MSKTTAVLCGVTIGLASLPHVPAYANGADLTSISRVEQSDDATGTPVYRLAENHPHRIVRPVRRPHANHPGCRVRISQLGSGRVGVVTGTVVDDSGTPVPNVPVRVVGRGKVVTSTTDANGRFMLGLDAGDYSISVESHGADAASSRKIVSHQAQVAPRSPARIDLTLASGISLLSSR